MQTSPAVNLTALPEALASIVDLLRDAIAEDDAIGQVAAEYGFNPVLLRRKFTEQHGLGPAEYAAAQSLAQARQISPLEITLAERRALARRKVTKCIRRAPPFVRAKPDLFEHAGKEVLHKGDLYVILLIQPVDLSTLAIKLADLQLYTLAGQFDDTLAPQLRAQEPVHLEI